MTGKFLISVGIVAFMGFGLVAAALNMPSKVKVQSLPRIGYEAACKIAVAEHKRRSRTDRPGQDCYETQSTFDGEQYKIAVYNSDAASPLLPMEMRSGIEAHVYIDRQGHVLKHVRLCNAKPCDLQ